MTRAKSQNSKHTSVCQAVAGFTVGRFLRHSRQLSDSAKVLLEELDLEMEKDNHTRLIRSSSQLHNDLSVFCKNYPIGDLDGHASDKPIRNLLVSADGLSQCLPQVTARLTRLKRASSNTVFIEEYRRTADFMRDPATDLISSFESLLMALSLSQQPRERS